VFNGLPVFGAVRCERPWTPAEKFVSPFVYWRSKVRLPMGHSLSQMRGTLASIEGVWIKTGSASANSKAVGIYMENAMRNRKEAGQALILTALALVVLMGFAGLAIDMGVMRYDKRLQQTAADAAAIAGASNQSFGESIAGVAAGAQDAATRVGYTDNGGGQVSNCTGAAVGTICVEANNPPKTGPHGCNGGTCDSNYVEALVAVVHPTYFMKILGINKETITARAVAASLGGGDGNGCLYTLNPPSSGAEEGIGGTGTLNASTCAIVDDGDYDGKVPIVTADTFAVAGSANGKSATCTAAGPCPTYSTPAASDPLSQLTPPCTSCSGGTAINVPGGGISGCNPGCTFSGGTYTISPGTYCSITIHGAASDQVVFSPGVYIIDGSTPACNSLKIPGDDTISGTGVTFYFTNSSTLKMGGTPTMNLTAPDSSGTYPGILMYQDPADTDTGPGPNKGPRLGGADNSLFKGALYFPKDQLTISGSTTGAGIKVGIVVANSLLLNVNPIVTLQGSAGLPSGVNVIKNATLVE
jgi:Flp pilus assembly protein TadG